MNRLTDLQFINASMPMVHKDKRFEIGVVDGKWVSIQPQDRLKYDPEFFTLEAIISAQGAQHNTHGTQQQGVTKIDLQGRMILPAFVDAHVHLDYFNTDCEETIKLEFRKTVMQAFSYGTTTMRVQLDLPFDFGIDKTMSHVRAALELKEELCDWIKLQVFPACVPSQLNSKEMEALRYIISLGIDGIGGKTCPSNEFKAEIDRMFKLADQYDMPLDLHLDDRGYHQFSEINHIAERTLQLGRQGTVAISHMNPAAQMDRLALDTMRKMMDAQLKAVILPGAKVYSREREQHRSSGVCAIKQFREAGIPIALGSEKITDRIHPMERGDLLQTGLLSSFSGYMTSKLDTVDILSMVTETPTSMVGMAASSLPIGQDVEFLIMDCKNTDDLLQWVPIPIWINQKGKWVYSSKASSDPWHTHSYEKWSQLAI